MIIASKVRKDSVAGPAAIDVLVSRYNLRSIMQGV